MDISTAEDMTPTMCYVISANVIGGRTTNTRHHHRLSPMMTAEMWGYRRTSGIRTPFEPPPSTLENPALSTLAFIGDTDIKQDSSGRWRGDRLGHYLSATGSRKSKGHKSRWPCSLCSSCCPAHRAKRGTCHHKPHHHPPAKAGL